MLKVAYESSFQAERERLLIIKGKDDVICKICEWKISNFLQGDLLGDPFYSIRAAKTNQIPIIANSNNDTNLHECFADNLKLNEVKNYENKLLK